MHRLTTDVAGALFFSAKEQARKGLFKQVGNERGQQQRAKEADERIVPLPDGFGIELRVLGAE